ncbi:MAG: hypothetical protein JRN52_13145 [Nitrososphaerota archaeon]|nr:hypothetical protein [Nitrososphaerota archaeon]
MANGTREEELKKEWKEKRSNHFFSVGHANQKGNGNTRLIHGDDDNASFYLEIRNWFQDDFKIPLHVPEHARQILPQLIDRSESVKLRKSGEVMSGGLAYSTRVVRNGRGYQVLISFELVEPEISWHGRLVGIDLNPEGIACTVVSRDGNLIATRFFRDNRLISASKNKRKWVLENLVNRMLNWCLCNYNCNALAVEDLKFKGAHDSDAKTNYKLSNFMKKKMIQTIKLHALRKSMLTLEVNPAYTSMVAIAKYGMQFGGFNRHQLAAFVIGRRALGYKESPTGICTTKTKKKEKRMWSYCSKNYYCGYKSQLQTLLPHEPMEWKSAWADNGGGTVTELLNKARPASTPETEKGLRSHFNAPADNRAGAVSSVIAPTTKRQEGSVHPNPHAREGDGATEHRVDSAPNGVDNLLCYAGNDTEDTVFW